MLIHLILLDAVGGDSNYESNTWVNMVHICNIMPRDICGIILKYVDSIHFILGSLRCNIKTTNPYDFIIGELSKKILFNEDLSHKYNKKLCYLKINNILNTGMFDKQVIQYGTVNRLMSVLNLIDSRIPRNLNYYAESQTKKHKWINDQYFLNITSLFKH
jgi:hypothetical protein